MSCDTSRTLLQFTEEKKRERDFYGQAGRVASTEITVSLCNRAATTAAVHCDRTVGQIAKNNHALRERSDTLGDRRLLAAQQSTRSPGHTGPIHRAINLRAARES